MIRSDLRTFLLAQSSVSSLIADRMHLCRAPEANDGRVWVSYQRVSGNYDHDLSGGSDRADPQFEFDVWGTDPDEVEAAGEAIRLVIYSAAGQTIGGGGTFIHEVILEEEQDFYHPSKVGDDVGRHRTRYRYKIGHTVARPT